LYFFFRLSRTAFALTTVRPVQRRSLLGASITAGYRTIVHINSSSIYFNSQSFYFYTLTCFYILADCRKGINLFSFDAVTMFLIKIRTS